MTMTLIDVSSAVSRRRGSDKMEEDVEAQCPDCDSEKLEFIGSNSNGLSGVEWEKYECKECGTIFVVDYAENKIVVEEGV